MTLAVRLSIAIFAYLATGVLALQIVAYPQGIAYFWPAAGIAAGVLIGARPAERVRFAAGIALAVIGANMLSGRGLAEALILAIANVGEAWLCALLFRKWTKGGSSLQSLPGVNLFILAAASAVLLSGLFAVFGLRLIDASGGPAWQAYRTWAVADFVGILTIAPLVVLLNAKVPAADPSRVLEGLLALAIITALAYLGYHSTATAPGLAGMTGFALALPVLVWITARAPLRLAAAAPPSVALLVTWEAGRGIAPASITPYSLDQQMIASQIDIAIFSIMALQLMALFAQYRSAVAQLAEERTQLEKQFNEFQALYAEAPLGLAMLDTEMRFVRINQALAEMNGFPVEAHIGRSVWDLVPALRHEAEAQLRGVLETGEPLRDVEIHGSTHAMPGVIREWCEQFYPVKMKGKVIGIGIVCEEVTEKRRAIDRERLLSREVDHRAKNMLAVVNSIVQLTQADDVASYREAISGRIQALARTHSLLAGSRWEGSGLAQILQEELAPFMREGRVTVTGADVLLSPPATQDLALVIHELATNAAKYGGLSTPSGRLDVAWSITQDAEGDVLDIDWTETGGPIVVAPERPGFGSALLEASVVDHLKGEVEQNWRPSGLSVNIRFPAENALANLRREPQPDVQDAPPASKPVSTRRARVLLVEDEPLIGLHARDCLEALGYEVVGPVARLEAAAAAARDVEADLALLDLNIGGQMTYSLAETLMARNIPCIFCTGYSEQTQLPEPLRNLTILQKPLSERALSEALERHLAG